MAQGFTGEVAQFTQAEKDVSATRAEMDRNLNALQDKIEATQAGWDGQAAVAFQNVMMRFNETGRKLNQSLQGIGELLAQAGSTYQASEEEQQTFVKSFNEGFGVLG
ncbi:WXG100 family type VII secretion target [Amycolatopsis nigrescens]|uniref:WXG100 family type VII secretion target n=1 Tax=Amycolatopsis nigrescens TaxID=381445 RepID=UPI0003640007|nr:WXG100 family type VII secretion target [Amycolatopsis nigrescens]